MLANDGFISSRLRLAEMVTASTNRTNRWPDAWQGQDDRLRWAGGNTAGDNGSQWASRVTHKAYVIGIRPGSA